MRPDPLAYAGARAALLTRHRKGREIGPVLGRVVGCEVLETDAFDTDRLGTFDGRLPRVDDQLATARRKAQLGREMLGLPLGIGSEGAFGPDPLLGTAPWDVELVLWIDADRGHEVAGWAQGPACAVTGEASKLDELASLAERAKFPGHGLCVSPVGGEPTEGAKGVTTRQALETAFRRCLAASPRGLARVENDLRAHHNPTRQGIIRKAAEELARRLSTPCPACGAPGFGLSHKITGLPCANCGEPTHLALAEVRACPACGHASRTPVIERTRANPADCPSCNP